MTFFYWIYKHFLRFLMLTVWYLALPLHSNITLKATIWMYILDTELSTDSWSVSSYSDRERHPHTQTPYEREHVYPPCNIPPCCSLFFQNVIYSHSSGSTLFWWMGLGTVQHCWKSVNVQFPTVYSSKQSNSNFRLPVFPLISLDWLGN